MGDKVKWRDAKPLRDRIKDLEAELKRFQEERSYVVGFNDGWSAALAEQEKTDGQ